MNAAVTESPSWPRRKWWGVVLGLCALQLLLLFWFGGRGPVESRVVARVPQLGLLNAAAASAFAHQDATLYAHGHPHGFSGAGWMSIPVPEYRPPEWTEAPRWLALDGQQLGTPLRRFVRTNRPFTLGLLAKPEPRLDGPRIAATSPATAASSALRVGGALTARRLLTEPALPAREHADLLTNSVVRVLVDGDGQVVSQVLLVQSGRPDADADALALARAARFEPLPRADGRPASDLPLMSGTLIFDWRTVPVTPTNAPATSP